ncbi:MAG: L-histidine N(alpha)-methyltransferase [Bacteroidota bacterium]
MRIFIASSSSALNYSYSVKAILEEKNLDAVVWKDAEFLVGDSIIESLESIKTLYDAAIFIFHPDDELNYKNQSFKSVRDNVIFEMGLFAGYLGIKKCFALVPNNISIKKPSDLLGILYATYKFNAQETNHTNAIRTAVEKISTSLIKKINEKNKTNFLVRGDYRNSLADASVSLDMLDFEMYQDWIQNIEKANRIKEELLYWERSTANRWIEYEKFTTKNNHHLFKLCDFLKQNFDQSLDVISLGPGSGEKDKIILRNLISEKHLHWYYPIDISSHLLFHTLKKITNEFNDINLKVKAIRANFNSLERLKFVYQYTNQLNVFLLLGNTIGNYQESNFLNTLRNAMFNQDLLVIEVNKLSKDEQSSGKFINNNYLEFILEPLKSIGFTPNANRLKFEVSKTKKSDVPNSVRINSNYYLSDEERAKFAGNQNFITVTHSTMYHTKSLLDYLKSQRFDVLFSNETDDQIITVVKISS